MFKTALILKLRQSFNKETQKGIFFKKMKAQN